MPNAVEIPDDELLDDEDIQICDSIPYPDTHSVTIGSVIVTSSSLEQAAKVAVVLAAYNRQDDMIDYDDRDAAIKDIEKIFPKFSELLSRGQH